MAEAAVEERPTAAQRFFCHKCSVEFDHVSSEYTCPHCMGGFIEELDNNDEDDDDVIDLEEELQEPYDMNAFLMDLERPHTVRSRFLPDTARRRRYTSTSTLQPRQRIGTLRPRALTARLAGARQANVFENLIQDFILNLGLGWTNNQVPGNMLLLGNPGDYAWGREGLDAIVTQLLNQMDGAGPPPLPKEAIEQIPTVGVTQEQVDAKTQCSVCWEDFVLHENVRKLPCQHVYHEPCICPWLELHGTCPICRQNLSPGTDNQTQDQRSANNGYAALQEFFQAVHDSGSSGSSGASSSSDSSSSSSGNSSDRFTMGSSSSEMDYN